MKAYVGVTDQRWYEYLAERPNLTEANFWLPGGGPDNFRALRANEPFLFKTHHPHNRLVGGGIFGDYRRLPLSLAWEAFGESNGAGSLDQMVAGIARYRKTAPDAVEDPLIGCVMLREVLFFGSDELVPAPADFTKNIVRGKGYEIGESTDSSRLISRTANSSPGTPTRYLAPDTHVRERSAERAIACSISMHDNP